jgi:tetratricopeptide (TPR) repeat protein
VLAILSAVLLASASFAQTQITAEQIMATAVDKHQKQDYVAAIEQYRKVLELNNKNVDAWFNLGSCYWVMEEWKNARTAYEKTYELAPLAKTEALYFIGRTYQKEKDKIKAMEFYRKYLKVNPRGPLTHDTNNRIERMETPPAPSTSDFQSKQPHCGNADTD